MLSQHQQTLFSKFALWCVNALIKDWEINSVQIISSLLDLSETYSNVQHFKCLNIQWVWKVVSGWLSMQDEPQQMVSLLANESCEIIKTRKPSTILNDYKFQSTKLTALCLVQYLMLVSHQSKSEQNYQGISFHTDYSLSDTHH